MVFSFTRLAAVAAGVGGAFTGVDFAVGDFFAVAFDVFAFGTPALLGATVAGKMFGMDDSEAAEMSAKLLSRSPTDDSQHLGFARSVQNDLDKGWGFDFELEEGRGVPSPTGTQYSSREATSEADLEQRVR
jgi:hypothetical protein